MSAADRRATGLLAFGTAAGIALAAFGIARSGRAPTPDTGDAVALVNGQPISRESFARFAAVVASERRQTELDSATRRHLLERMIDEELLFQRGVALGLARHEPTARRAIVAAMVASVGADGEVVEPDEAELRRFYEENRERFTRPGRLELEVAFVRTADKPDALAFRRAGEIARRVRSGEPLERVREELGDEPVAPLPGGPLSFETLRQYLGPTVARSAFDLEPGGVSDPVRGGDGYYVLRLDGATPGEVAAFEEVREQVRSEALRSRGDQALRDYLAGLRAGGDVEVLDPELDGAS